MEHKFITFYDKISPYLFQYLHHLFRHVLSRPVLFCPVPSRSVPSAYQTYIKYLIWDNGILVIILVYIPILLN
ncbi:hypothetical protein DVH24_001039 [Malus domestica]|uniref:Uncharacterized protein n=1 Tax=Malus domestica TaxID=3750 RepID=A0A498K499_MALDO|nr:hypothetical protein DVH24_001039 [Malus domestica]